MEPINYYIPPSVAPEMAISNAFLNYGAMKKQEAETKAEELKRNREDQYNLKLHEALQKPIASSFAKLMLEFPDKAKAIGEGFSLMDTAQRDQLFGDGSKVYAALDAGDITSANRALDENIQALGGETNPKAQDYVQIKETAKKDPKQAQGLLGMILASQDPKRFHTMMEGRASIYEGDKKKADSISAAIKSNYAESEAAIDIQKKGMDIWKIAQDAEIARINTRLAAARLALEKEKQPLELKKLQAEADKISSERDEKVREKVAEYETKASDIQAGLSLIDRILTTPSDVRRAALGAVDSQIFTIQNSVADFESDVQTLKSQVFLSQISRMKNLGALSDAEGKKVEAAVRSLDLRQSESQFLNNINFIQSTMKKAQATLDERYGVTQKPVQQTAPTIEQLLNKYR